MDVPSKYEKEKTLFVSQEDFPASKRVRLSSDSGEQELQDVFNSSYRAEMDKKMYFDFNATTPLEPSVINIVNKSMREAWGNPSSLYENGKLAKSMIDQAREHIADMLDGSAQDILFTSGGTESNNMVFYSTIDLFNAFKSTRDSKDSISQTKPHIITSNVEHDSIIKMAKALEAKQLIELTVCEVSPKTGVLMPDIVCALARDNTILVSVMLANNETGIIQDVESIASQLKDVNALRKRKGLPQILLHTDAAQAIGKIPVSVNDLGVDYLTVVGHKFYGPRIGALWVKDRQFDRSKISPLLFGGGQEGGLRPGTENTPMICGLGEAARLVACNVTQYGNSMEKLRDYFEEKLSRLLNGAVHFNGRYRDSNRLPNTSNISFVGHGLEGHRVLSYCQSIQASVGAACHSDQATKPSRILIASGVPEHIARNAIRLSFGRETTLLEVDQLVDDLLHTISSLLPSEEEKAPTY